MATSVCDEGARLYDKFKKLDNTYRRFGRIHMMLFMVQAAQAYRQHVEQCAICKEE